MVLVLQSVLNHISLTIWPNESGNISLAVWSAVGICKKIKIVNLDRSDPVFFFVLLQKLIVSWKKFQAISSSVLLFEGFSTLKIIFSNIVFKSN